MKAIITVWYQTEPKLKFLEVTRINHSVDAKSSKGGGRQTGSATQAEAMSPH